MGLGAGAWGGGGAGAGAGAGAGPDLALRSFHLPVPSLYTQRLDRDGLDYPGYDITLVARVSLIDVTYVHSVVLEIVNYMSRCAFSIALWGGWPWERGAHERMNRLPRS